MDMFLQCANSTGKDPLDCLQCSEFLPIHHAWPQLVAGMVCIGHIELLPLWIFLHFLHYLLLCQLLQIGGSSVARTLDLKQGVRWGYDCTARPGEDISIEISRGIGRCKQAVH